MLRIHASRYPDQATTSLIRSMSASAAKGRRCYFVVPSQFTVEAEQILFDALERDTLLQIQVKTFRSLERELLEAGKGLKHPQLTDSGRVMLLRLLAEELGETWRCFSRGVRGSGFFERLAEELREFKEYGIHPQMLSELSQAENLSQSTAGKLAELAEIYAAYEKCLSDRYLDGDDRLKMAFSQLHSLPVLDGIDFFFDGFHSMSQLELDGVSALLKRGLTCHFALTCDPRLVRETLRPDASLGRAERQRQSDAAVEDAEVFSIAEHFLTKLAEAADGCVEQEDTSSAGGQPKEIFAHAAAQVFSYRVKAKTFLECPVSIYSYRSTEAEIDAAIIEIRRLVSEKRCRYRDIQIVLSDTAEYAGLLKRKLAWENIPFFFDERRSIDVFPLIQFLKSALNIARRNYRRPDVLNFAKSGLCGIGDDALGVYQNFLKRRKIDRGMFEQPHYFETDETYLANHPRRKEGLQEEYSVARAVNDQVLSLIRDFVHMAQGNRRIADFAEGVYLLLTQEPVTAALDAFETQLRDAGEEANFEAQRQIWDQVMALLDQLADIGGDSVVSFDVFCAVLEEGMKGLSVGIIPPYRDGVFINPLIRSRARTRKQVFILGMNDLYLPQVSKSTTLLSEEEQQLLREKGYYLPSMRSFASEEEALSFYVLLHRVGEHLRLSFSIQNSSGEGMLASYWLLQLKQSISGLAIQSVSRFSLSEQLRSRSMLSLSLPEIMRDGSASSVKKRAAQAIMEKMKKNEELKPLYQALCAALQYRNKRNALSAETALHLYGERDSISVSQIETYAKCPYRYFLDYGLRPEVPRELDVSPADVGVAVHGAIDRWTAMLAEDPEKFRKKTEEEALGFAKEAFHEEAAEVMDARQKEHPKNAYILALTEKTICEAHRRLWHQIQQSKIGKIYHEERFGRRAAFAPIVIETQGRSLYIEGRMDRVDELSEREEGVTYLQVIDYKTGQRSFQLSRVLGGLDLQLTLYLAAATQQSDRVRPLGCFYLPITPAPQLEEGSDDELRELLTAKGLLDGVLVCDEKALRGMDESFAMDDAKEIASNTVYKLSGRKRSWEEKDNVLTPEELRRLLEESMSVARALLTELDRGVIDVAPYYLKDGAGVRYGCEYCGYSSVCRFDREEQFSDYRFIEKKSWDQWKEGGR
ncbi:MAG: PD-(D/E)XK nuclease family protein [Ndongobacter sp.]|nr:PD-(D/E)XK nuclease family protein [Ndongobacter sp.]